MSFLDQVKQAFSRPEKQRVAKRSDLSYQVEVGTAIRQHRPDWLKTLMLDPRFDPNHIRNSNRMPVWHEAILVESLECVELMLSTRNDVDIHYNQGPSSHPALHLLAFIDWDAPDEITATRLVGR